ncbi:hypothetical protein [Pseudomonas syringae]|uniref:hypothetical protein n=1 Tax=Pseudomonas syringae TaxID=317 RepID=UPI001267E59A|nr:hypothetical protein [Pseudomonas syringae]
MTSSRKNASAFYNLTDQAFISGLVLVWQGGNSFAITAGSAYIPSLGQNISTGSIGSGALSMAASTWYHAYVYPSGANLAIEVSATAPSAAYWGSARTKTGDSSRRYLGSVYANANGLIQKFYCDNVRYRVSTFDASQNRILANGSATTATSLSVANFAPLSATKIYVKLNNYLTGPSTLLQLGPAQAEPQQIILQGSSGVSILQYADVDVVANQIWYSYNIAPPSGGGGFIDCFGYEISR